MLSENCPNSIAFQVGTVVAVTGVSLDKAEATIPVAGTVQLAATVAPANASNKNVTWSSASQSIATVNSNGLVTAVSEGTTTITATTQDGGKKANCTITVIRASLTSDPYEPNNTLSQSRALTVTFTNNTATVRTTGANFHNDTDVDYYKIDLPSGYQYTINARLHDSCNSDNGNTYTIDAQFEYSTNGNSWSEFYDDLMPDQIDIADGGTIYFHVVPFYEGETGTYLLDMSIERRSSNANLRSLSVSQGTLTPAFNANTVAYTVNVAGNVTSITVSAAAAETTSSVEGTGAKSLNVGDNRIEVKVTAQNGNVKTYTITVVRPASNNADLKSLSVNQGILTPTFNASTVAYTVNVANSVSSITVSATVADNTATLEGTGVYSLGEGSNSIPVKVTAQNGTVKTYTITVFRPASNNADLKSLSVNHGTLTPTFNANTVAYTVTVANSVSSITVSATMADNTATLEGTGDYSLDVGNNLIEVKVTAQDGKTVKTYTITVFRAAINNVDLSTLSVNPGTLFPAFNNNITAYIVNVANSVSSITISATALDDAAIVEGTGVHLLEPGNNPIEVKVTNQISGTVKIYTIMVVRAASNNALLGSVLVNDQPAVPKREDILTWSVTLNVTTSINIVASTVHHAATLQENHLGKKTVQMGVNVFEITVTAESGNKLNYRLEVIVNDLSNSAFEQTAQPLTVYPNPASGQFVISGLEGDGVLTVLDSAGRQWIRSSIASSQETISISDLPQGIYIVQVIEGTSVRTIKIIVL